MSDRLNVRPPPVTPVTVIFAEIESVATRASSTSLAALVEKLPLLMEVEAEVLFFDTFTSMASAAVVTCWAVKLMPVTALPLTGTLCDGGAKLYPDADGVTVYVPFGNPLNP